MGTDYTVWEETPLEDSCSRSEPQNASFVPDPFNPFRPDDYDPREPALRLDIATLEVHHVNRVKFETECHSVTRLRRKKTPEDQEMGWDGLTLGGKL